MFGERPVCVCESLGEALRKEGAWLERQSVGVGDYVQEGEGMKEDKRKGVYIGAPACFELERCCQDLHRAFSENGVGGIYLVGSALERSDWRDIDIRMMLSDEEFDVLFPDAGERWEFDPRWIILTVSISQWMSKLTGLPIDFQFQRTNHANEHYKGPRSAMGMFYRKPIEEG